MKIYSTLIFDAFDTVVHIDRSKLPRHKMGGRFGHTTAPRVYELYASEDGAVSFEQFLAAFLESSAEAYRRRQSNLREIPSADRFRIMLEILGKHEDASDLPERLARIHMATFQPALEIRPENRALLAWALGSGYRLGMVSNFDYSPALYDCLDKHGVRAMFETILVSDEVGWRKPHPEIFRLTMTRMGIDPAEALFIGDRLEIDVDGAVRAGMDAAWVDTGREIWTPGHSRPRYTIGSLEQLQDLLKFGDGGVLTPPSPN